MIFLVKDSNTVRAFYSEDEMKAAGYKKADHTVSEEQYNSNGCYARIIGGNIVVGKTDEEKAAEEKQEKITDCIEQLEQIDRELSAGRHVRDVSVSAGAVLGAVRVLVSRFAEKLEIKLPKNFGDGAQKVEDILALAPPANATEKEKADFDMYRALLLVSNYNPTINPGLTKMKEAEVRAASVREELSKLLRS